MGEGFVCFSTWEGLAICSGWKYEWRFCLSFYMRGFGYLKIWVKVLSVFIHEKVLSICSGWTSWWTPRPGQALVWSDEGSDGDFGRFL